MSGCSDKGKNSSGAPRSAVSATDQRGSRHTMGSEHKYPSSSREMRNIAEKMRRDKLNNYVTELASIVPLVSGANKRVDKTSVLRLAANFIRIHKILQTDEPKKKTVPGGVESIVSHSIAQAIGGFLMVVTSSGKVLYVSEAMEEIFGHSQVDLLGRSIYHVIHPEDYEIIQEQLNSKDPSRRSFFCRMMEKALSRNDPSRYEIVHIVGTMKLLPQLFASFPRQSEGCDESSKSPRDLGDKSFSDGEDRVDSDSEGDDSQSTPAVNKVGSHMLVAFVRVVKDRPITELSLVESTQEEYITRHAMDGKILYTDHRISFVTGLMPQEVLGTSAFHYMHPDDLVWSVVAHKLMFSSSQGQGMVSYRLRCKGSAFVTLRSRGYIEANKQTGQAETFVCINTVVSSKESESELKSQRRKLLPMVTSPQGDNHLTTVSSAMPPELLAAIKKMLDPSYVKKLFDSISDMGSQASLTLGLTDTQKSEVSLPRAVSTEPIMAPQSFRSPSAPRSSSDNLKTATDFPENANKSSRKRGLDGGTSPQTKKLCSSEFFLGQEVPLGRDFQSESTLTEQNQSFNKQGYCQSNSSLFGNPSPSPVTVPSPNAVCDPMTPRTPQTLATSVRPHYEPRSAYSLPRPAECNAPGFGSPLGDPREGYQQDKGALMASSNPSKDGSRVSVMGRSQTSIGDVPYASPGFKANGSRHVDQNNQQPEVVSPTMFPSIAAQNHPFQHNSSPVAHSKQSRIFTPAPPSHPPNQTDQSINYTQMDVSIASQRQQLQESELLRSRHQCLKPQQPMQNQRHCKQDQTQDSNYQVAVTCHPTVQNYQAGGLCQSIRQPPEHQKTGLQLQPEGHFQHPMQTGHSLHRQHAEMQQRQCQQPGIHQQQPRHQESMTHQQSHQQSQVELPHQQCRSQMFGSQYQPVRPHHVETHRQPGGHMQYMGQHAHGRPQTQVLANIPGQDFSGGHIQQSTSHFHHFQSTAELCQPENQSGFYGLFNHMSAAPSRNTH